MSAAAKLYFLPRFVPIVGKVGLAALAALVSFPLGRKVAERDAAREAAMSGNVRVVSQTTDPVRETPDDPIWSRFWMAVDQPARDRDEVARTVLEWSAAARGMSVLEVGAGGGYFTVRYARAVGPTGRVWATDIDLRMARKVAWEAHSRGLHHVIAMQVREGHLGVPDESVDLATFVETGAFRRCNEARNEAYVTRLAAVLRRGGRVVVQNQYERPGLADYVADCPKLDPDAVVSLFARHFTVSRRASFTRPDGWHGYALMFTRR